MSKHRIKAFTILEMTIAMVLSAIVISITYTAFSIVYRSYLSFQKKNNELAILTEVDYLLKKDFLHADTILQTQDGITFKGSNGTIKYEIDTGFIVRTSLVTDTFKLRSRGINALFEGQPTEQPNLIDELEFTIIFQNENFPYHYHKLYSSMNLTEKNPDAIN